MSDKADYSTARVYDSVRESSHKKFVSDTVIGLYAALAQSLLYPFNHPLVSDTLKNAFQSLQKVLRSKPSIRLETAGGKLLFDGEILDDGEFVAGHFASWLNSRNIRALSFDGNLSRRELIHFHRIISMKKLPFEEIAKAMAEKFITNVGIVPMHVSGPRDEAATPAQSLIQDYESTRYHVDDIADTGLIEGFESTRYQESAAGLSPADMDSRLVDRVQDAGREVRKRLVRGLEGISYHMDESQAHSPLFIRPADASPLEDASGYGLIEGFESTGYLEEIPADLSPAGADSGGDGSTGEGAEVSRYVDCVDALLDHDISEDEQALVRRIPPERMAHLVNAMLFKSPGAKVLNRVVGVYFTETEGLDAKDVSERCRAFLTLLRSDLRPLFAVRCSSFCPTDDFLSQEDADSLLQGGQETPGPSLQETVEGMPVADPAFVPSRTIDGCDFTFDFVAHGNAVIHDIEMPRETASLFHKARLARFREGGMRDALPASADDAAADEGSYAAIIAECTEETITEASFQVVLDLIESNSLDEDAYRKLEARLVPILELFLQKGEFAQVLDVFNSLKTQSLQGQWSASAAAMIRRIFASETFNFSVVDALRQYGRKERDSASRLTVALRSFLVPYLLDALGEETDASTRRLMMTLLTEVRSDALRYISQRLRDSRWYVLRNMLYLLRECHGQHLTTTVRKFLEHEEPAVGLEALRTLLSFQDPKTDVFVTKFLTSDSLQLQKGAVRLAGAYRTRIAVPHLIRLLLEKDILGKKLPFKKGIVRALGRIGDGRAVSHLLNICRSTTVLRKDELDRLKIEIFRTLQNYPANVIGPLTDYGLQSGNEEIVAISKKLMNQYGLTARKKVVTVT